jgi:tetratricopeptide (TPR) repeat protein
MQKAMTHHRQHELQEALNLYAQVIEAEPRHFDALHLAGVLLVQDNHYEHALPLLDRAMALKPRHHELHHNRGNALHGLKRLKEALQSYVKCIELKPDFGLAYLGQSNVLADLQANEQAIASIDSAIKLMPGYALLFFNRGNLMDSLGKKDEAIRSFDRAVALEPAYFEAWHNRGNLLALCNRFTEARNSYQHAVRLRPDHPDAYVSLAATYMSQGDYDKALNEFTRVIERFPQNANAHYIYSHQLLQTGLFEQAWAEYAWRWQASMVEMRRPLASTQPRWTPASKPERLLVWAEQGVGDEIFWVQQLRAVQQLAPHVIVQTDPRLLDLFSRALPQVRFVSSKEFVPETDYDAHLPMGDLGQALQLNADKVSQMTGPFLNADDAQAQHIRAQLCPPGLKLCGLSWKSTNKHTEKSMALQDLLPALKVPGVIFVNLQYGDVAQEIADLHAQHGI